MPLGKWRSQEWRARHWRARAAPRRRSTALGPSAICTRDVAQFEDVARDDSQKSLASRKSLVTVTRISCSLLGPFGRVPITPLAARRCQVARRSARTIAQHLTIVLAEGRRRARSATARPASRANGGQGYSRARCADGREARRTRGVKLRVLGHQRRRHHRRGGNTRVGKALHRRVELLPANQSCNRRSISSARSRRPATPTGPIVCTRRADPSDRPAPPLPSVRTVTAIQSSSPAHR